MSHRNSGLATAAIVSFVDHPEPRYFAGLLDYFQQGWEKTLRTSPGLTGLRFADVAAHDLPKGALACRSYVWQDDQGQQFQQGIGFFCLNDRPAEAVLHFSTLAFGSLSQQPLNDAGRGRLEQQGLEVFRGLEIETTAIASFTPPRLCGPEQSRGRHFCDWQEDGYDRKIRLTTEQHRLVEFSRNPKGDRKRYTIDAHRKWEETLNAELQDTLANRAEDLKLRRFRTDYLPAKQMEGGEAHCLNYDIKFENGEGKDIAMIGALCGRYDGNQDLWTLVSLHGLERGQSASSEGFPGMMQRVLRSLEF